MSAETSNQAFARQVEALRQQTHELHTLVASPPWRHFQLVTEFLNGFWRLLEELHTAQEELRKQNQELLATRQKLEVDRDYYRELFDFAPDAYLVTDAGGTIREANHAAVQLLGSDRAHLVSQPFASFVSETDRATFYAMLAQLHHSNRLEEWEVRLQGRDLMQNAAITVTAAQDREGRKILRWQVRNITTRKQAEKQLHQLQRQNLQLVEADRVKAQFLATVSHELRTPINAIMGFSQVLLRWSCNRFEPQQQTRMLERILASSERLLALVEDILDFAQLKAQRLELKVEPFDLVELITNTIGEMRSLTTQKNLALQVQLPPSLVVVNDPVRVRQVVANLLSNAIKYTDRGHISIALTELPKDRLAISVSDTGIGIAEEDMQLIFQEFRQIDQTLTRRHEGTGLGLAITHALVRIMRGSISVKSCIDQGSTFRVELPRSIVLSSTDNSY